MKFQRAQSPENFLFKVYFRMDENLLIIVIRNVYWLDWWFIFESPPFLEWFLHVISLRKAKNENVETWKYELIYNKKYTSKLVYA